MPHCHVRIFWTFPFIGGHCGGGDNICLESKLGIFVLSDQNVSFHLKKSFNTTVT